MQPIHILFFFSSQMEQSFFFSLNFIKICSAIVYKFKKKKKRINKIFIFFFVCILTAEEFLSELDAKYLSLHSNRDTTEQRNVFFLLFCVWIDFSKFMRPLNVIFFNWDVLIFELHPFPFNQNRFSMFHKLNKNIEKWNKHL